MCQNDIMNKMTYYIQICIYSNSDNKSNAIKINIIIMTYNIKHLTVHLNVLEIYYKSIYTQLESVHKFSVNTGLILTKLCLLLCPIPLRKGKNHL